MMLPASHQAPATVRQRWVIHGRVQGVGFRPAMFRWARQCGLVGWVGNTAAGVTLEIEGPPAALAQFAAGFDQALPRMAQVNACQTVDLPVQGEADFVLQESLPGGPLTLVPPDLAVCPACLAELFDPASRHYHDAFVSCTDCGPRYSMVTALPWERRHTSMAAFAPCPVCWADYHNPAHRRFHHQGISCPACGPRLSYARPSGEAVPGDALDAAVACLAAGGIVAVMGLGGFMLMADATDPHAIHTLRQRKHRPDKPLAVMFADVAAIAAECELSADAAAVLQDAASPLLLLPWRRQQVHELAAPGQNRLGVMRAYTPLHALLLQRLGHPLIATSGNRGGEPLCIAAEQVFSQLADVVDGVLWHERVIQRGVDDSVAQLVDGELQLIRRARGFVPEVLPGPVMPPTLALGGHLKNTLALAAEGQMMVSAHLGDLDHPAARSWFQHHCADLPRLVQVTPRQIVCDLHPDYASSLWAEQLKLPTLRIQHHVAHLAACALEHGLELPVLGSVWDGSGLGADGTQWGGETLQLEQGRWQRLAHWWPFDLPGGDKAAREPRRAGLAVLLEVLGDAAWQHPRILAAFSAAELGLLRQSHARGLAWAPSTSTGRLFDAVAFLLGFAPQRQSYEGMAAIWLQNLAEQAKAQAAITLNLPAIDGMDWRPWLAGLLAKTRPDPAVCALAWHRALAQVVAQQAKQHRAQSWLVAGGCWHNALLLQLARQQCKEERIQLYAPARYPAGDGALALGQLAAVAWGCAQN